MRWWVRGEERATVSTIALPPMANLGDYMIMMTELALVMTELTLADQDPQQGGDSLPLEDDEEDWGKFIELNLILNGRSNSNYNLEHHFAQVWSDQPGLELYTGNFLPDQVVDLDHARSK